MKKHNVTYAEIYVRDLLIERDSAAFYRNLMAQLSHLVDEPHRCLLREWAKLDDELELACADGWLPAGDDIDSVNSDDGRMNCWVAYNAALAAESKARLYYDTVKKRCVDPHALALAETRVSQRDCRIEQLKAMVAATPRPHELEAVEEKHAHQWLQRQVGAFGGFRFVHSEAAA
ncbi:MAG TPA: hypothetical protein VFW68_10125 [Rhodocyclaceae bacterium]|nr:hypothetical protein [Rhodocyclaceae bacterium]